MEAKSKATEVSRYRFNADQYHKMKEVGILPMERGVELLGGVVWDPSPLVRNRCHPALKGGVTRFLNELVGLPEELDAQIHKYTADEYQVMGIEGILTEDDRVELIDGEIVLMPPMLDPHAFAISRLIVLFGSLFMETRVTPWVQCPIRSSYNGQPEPDLALLRPDLRRDRLPTPHDVLLVVEVSDSTLRFDRNVKAALYALNEIPEMWLVNLREDVIEVYRNPQGGVYLEVTRLRRGDKISPSAFPDVVLDVADILG
jgi:Uma2 family endonuclease